MKTCPAGHLKIDGNLLDKRHPSGRIYKTCRTCHARRMNLKYRHNDAWREEIKRKNLERYYRNKQGETADGRP